MSSTGVAANQVANGATKEKRAERVIVAFICENAGRPGLAPSSGIRRRPSAPDFGWPFPVEEVLVPCAGRLQPEHLLKVIEDGADAIGVICCEEGNCHHLEGNRRCSRRLDYVGGLLDQLGLGKDRLMAFRLPGSAKEDMALGLGAGLPSLADAGAQATMKRKIAEVRDAFVARLATIPRSPLSKGALPEESPYEVEDQDDSDE
jgi:F420-non-reducing hydrogenase iron-sulfur subunit